MTQDVDAIVIAANLAVTVVRAMPLVDDLDNLDTPLFQIKTKRPLLAAVSGITFHPHTQQPCSRFLIHSRHVPMHEVQAAVNDILVPTIKLVL